MYLEKIQGPKDVKKLNVNEMQELAVEMRKALLTKLSKHGGHFGPNFGMVEATIAMHYVFDSPKDKIVYDVSHQSYPHSFMRSIMMTSADTASRTRVSMITLSSVTHRHPSALHAVLQRAEIYAVAKKM